MNPFAFLLVGLALGLIIGWLLSFLRRHDNRIEIELREQLKQREGELAQTRSELAEVSTFRARADAAKDAANTGLVEQRQAQERLQADLSSLREELLAHKRQNGESVAEIKFLNERLATERQQVEAIQAKFQKEFEAVSNKLLLDNSSQFSKQSTENLDRLLTPLKDELKDFKTKLDTAQRETATHSALLKDQVGRIGTEAANLSKALKGDVKILGNWGENMLDQILEKSGLQLGLHFRRQRGAKDAESDQRFLDVIIDLPDDKHLIIDSKVSIKCYEEHVNAADETSRQKYLDDHIECLRKHFRDLGMKRYQDLHGLNTPDFVLMYIPIETAFFVAVKEEPNLFAEAFEKNVVLVTNSTLLTTLRTVAGVWRLADQQKNALEIADRGGKLYDKFVGFISDLQNVGNALKKGHEAWEEATGKLHTGPGNLVRQAEQLKALGAKASKSLPTHISDKATDEVSLPAISTH